MKILLSAYACAPEQGSEPSAGWNWAYELSKRGHDLYVITRSNNQETIEKYLTDKELDPSINFIYYDLPKLITNLKKTFKFTRIYYVLWQFMILRKCIKLNKKIKFDLIHHITFGSLRHFSFLGQLKSNTIIGPLGGAETSPFWLRRHIGLQGAVSETFRDIFNLITFVDPFYLMAAKKCRKLIFTTKAGIKYCPKEYRKKVHICPIIGLNDDEYSPVKVSIKYQKKVLFAGRHLHWKGMEIGIEAFKDALERDSELSLTIVGSGNASKHWKNLINKYQISNSVSWLPWVSKYEYERIFNEHGIFLFPSLHDSGGFAVLDALKHGLPVICFDLGGPADTVNESSGIIIKTDIKNYKLLIRNFSSAITHLSSDKKSWELFSIGAQKRSRDFSNKKIIDKIY